MNFRSQSSSRNRGRFWQTPIVLPLCFALLIALGSLTSPASAADTQPITEPTSEPTDKATPTPEPTSEPTDEAEAEKEEGTSDKDEKSGSAAPTESKDQGGLLSTMLAAIGEGTLSLTLTQATGTGPFDADDDAGHDSSATNDIVRTNDTIAYTVGVRFEGEDQTNPTIKFTLPKGQQLESLLPPFCLSGSGVTPASLPAPETPVTATSWQSLPTQEVTCRVADQTVGTSLDYKFLAKVRSEMPNGTEMDPVVGTATSDQVTTPAESPSVSQTVSAAPQFDLSKRDIASTDNAGPLHQVSQACSFDASRGCKLILFPLTLTTPDGAKGISPLQSPITFTDDLSPDAFYGSGTTTSAAWTAAGAGALDKYGARIAGCSWPNQFYGQLPAYKAGTGGYTTKNAVRDSGTITCTQPGGPGTPVSYSILDADTTGYTVPEKSLSGNALQSNRGYVVSTTIAVEVPFEAIKDLGTEASDSVWTLNWRNTFTDVKAQDVAGQDNVDPPANNTRTGSSRYELEGSFAKTFSGVAGAANNTSACGFAACRWEGPPGSSEQRDGNTVVVPGQRVISNLLQTNDVPPGSGSAFEHTLLLCDVWDESKLALAAGDYPAGGARQQHIASAGAPVWISSFDAHGISHTNTDDLDNLKIQYSSGPAGSGGDSECESGTWYDKPEDVPGAVKSPDGTYSVVNRVRVSFFVESDPTSRNFDVNVAIGMQVRQGAIGTVLPNWASRTGAAGNTDIDGILAGPHDWQRSNYVPTTHVGGAGDRLILGGVTARIKKYVKNPTSGDFTDSAVPQYTAGSEIDYRLNPSLTADVAAGTKDHVFVEDCLPKYQQFVSSKREGSGSPITPVIVQAGSPAGAGLTCDPGETYIKWDLGQNVVNDPIDPIVYTIEVLETARNGNYLNETLISAAGDPSPASLRDDTAQVQIVVPTGIKISKSTPQNVVEINPTDVPNPRTLKWKVDFANIDSPAEVSNVDVIDVLPANGVGGTDFTGSLAFTSAEVAAGSDITILYTKGAPAGLELDPDDASNGAAGATVWCSSANGGTVVSGSGSATDCPASPAEVTGLRFLRPGDFDPDDELTVDIVMTPAANASGDVYRNHTSGRVVGVSQGVGPAVREIKVIDSAVGNYVWEDLDKDGIQDDDEPGVPDFPVSLVGKDLDGNPVNLSTTTNANGMYSFKGLASGTYKVVFSPDALGSARTFTVRNAGSDDARDSDGDITTGETAEFALAPDSDDPTRDQGLIIDRKADISVVKQLVDGYPQVNEDGTSKVAYDITVTNSGNAAGPYDLKDILHYGDGVEILGASATNTSPGDIPVKDDWDGVKQTTLVDDQEIGTDSTHVYRIVVDAKAPTDITTSAANCKLATHESGTGFLNEAELTFDRTTYQDSSCGGTPGGGGSDDGVLPDTGGPAFWLLVFASLLICAGGFTLARSRRREQGESGR